MENLANMALALVLMYRVDTAEDFERYMHAASNASNEVTSDSA